MKNMTVKLRRGGVFPATKSPRLARRVATKLVHVARRVATGVTRRARRLTAKIGRWWRRFCSSPHRVRNFVIAYSVVFVAVCLLVFIYYLASKTTFVQSDDGWRQHYKALVYFGQWLRQIAKSLFFDHQLNIPEWGFAFGEGNSVLASLCYYVLGDPLNLLAVFVPTGLMWVLYGGLVIVRLYLAGLVFAWLCFYVKKNAGRLAVLTGAILYAFCWWGLHAGLRHPYFLNPMIYFPLIILGMEKILRGDRPYVLILGVFVAGISNFYFFYLIVILTVIYVAVRLIAKYRRRWREMGQALLRIMVASVLGAVMAGVLLLPVLVIFLGDVRSGVMGTQALEYPMSYYAKLPGSLFADNGSYWLFAGCAVPVTLALFLLFLQKKKYRFLKICVLICAVLAVVPLCASVLNGMSYVTNRWSWVVALLLAFIFVEMWPRLMRLRWREIWKLGMILTVCLGILLFLDYSRSELALASLALGGVTLFLLSPLPAGAGRFARFCREHRPQLLLGLVVVCIGIMGYFLNISTSVDRVDNHKTIAEVKNLTKTEVKAVQKVAESEGVTDFYRYSGRSLTSNANIFSGISGTNYYWTISNSSVADFRSDLGVAEYSLYYFTGYDDRSALLSLASVRFYAIKSSDTAPAPYGFEYVDKINVKSSKTGSAKTELKAELGTDELSAAQTKVLSDATASTWKIYENDYALPLGYTYENVISAETWENYSALEKQEAMLSGVYLADYDGETQDERIALTGQALDYEVKCNSTGVTLEGDSFVVTSAKSSVTLTFDGLKNAETYVAFANLDFKDTTTYRLYFGDAKFDPLELFSETRWNLLSFSDQEALKKSDFYHSGTTGVDLTLKASTGVSKTLGYHTEYYSYYNGRHDFAVNLDYSEEAVSSVTITFPAIGIYTFDELTVFAQPMDAYAEQISALRADVLENEEIGTDTVAGTITLSSPKILLISLPYTDGWTAYVDGQEAQLYRANVKNMALALPAGEHEILLVYETPYLRLGAVVSVAGFVGFSGVVWAERRRRKIKREQRGSKKYRNVGGEKQKMPKCRQRKRRTEH